MNYIILNDKGRLKDSHIDDLYQGSANVDVIYIFADFDISDKSVGVMFKRYDGFKIGEVEAMPCTAAHPLSGENKDCFSIVLASDVLTVSGPLQISVKYYSDYVEDNITIQQVRATALVVTDIRETVSAVGYKPTVITNINRRIDALIDRIESLEALLDT